MSNRRKGLLIAVCLLAVPPVHASWAPLGSPEPPLIELRLEPSRPELLYARVAADQDGATGYLWRSEDAGATWRDVQSGLDRPFAALAIDPANPRVIWVWTRDGELWRSPDAGSTWVRRSASTSPVAPNVLQLLVDPRHPDTLLRVDLDQSRKVVSVSLDGGVSFARGTHLSPFASFDSIQYQPRHDELVSFDDRGLEISTDHGQSWTVGGRFRHTGFVGGRLAPSDPDTMYAVPLLPNQCLARSDDAGAHWQALGFPPRLPAANSGCMGVAIDPEDARHLWVVANLTRGDLRHNRTYESRDGGVTWARGFDVPADGIVAAGGELLYTGGLQGTGLAVSRDGGHTWTPTDQGIIAGSLRNGLVAQRLPGGGPGRRLLALDSPLTGIADQLYRSDGGKTWISLPFEAVAIANAGGSHVVEADTSGVQWSADGGETWTVAVSAPPNAQGLRTDLVQPRYLALPAFEEQGPYGNVAIWTSDDAGGSWKRTSDGLPVACLHVDDQDDCPLFDAYAVDPYAPSRRWLTARYHFASTPTQPRIFLSVDGGASWQVETTDLAATHALAADPAVPGRLLAGTDNGLLASTDLGVHWSPLGDLPAGAVIRQFARDGATWYAATTAAGIFRSQDGGAHWTLLAGAPDRDNPTIAVDPRRPTALLAAFAGQGVWRWTP
jgi:photosystem II stability/assembly factor-like uncharacterized protein